MSSLKKFSSIILIVLMLLSMVPSTVFATADRQQMSEEFSKVLTDGKLVLNSVKPTSMDDEIIWIVADDFCFANTNFMFNPDTFTEDFSKVELSMHAGETEKHIVDVVWNYDVEILEGAQAITDNFPEEWSSYIHLELSDLELINYLIYHTPGIKSGALANYSSEFKSALGESNFYFEVQTFGGGRVPFYTTNGGVARLLHNGTVYQSLGGINAKANHVIYVPENTADTKEALIAAAQKRINDYIGENIIQITDSGEMVSDYEEEYSDYFEEDGLFYFLNDAAGGYVFNVKVSGKEETYKFVVIKDDTKLTVPTYASTDFKTKVSVSTDSSEVPLDTVVKVEKITHGEEHERICGTLEIKDGEIFDIKLHSGSLDDYITELKNGKFKVRLPIKNEYKGKELVVYYVDANGNKTKYNVTIKNNFAFFETDHFSIYTLTTVSNEAPTPDNVTTSSVPDNNVTSPNTGENSNVYFWAIMLFASLIGPFLAFLSRKKKIRN